MEARQTFKAVLKMILFSLSSTQISQEYYFVLRTSCLSLWPGTPSKKLSAPKNLGNKITYIYIKRKLF